LGQAVGRGGLYILDELKVLVATVNNVDLSSFYLSLFSSSLYLWHSSLRCVSSSRLRFLASIEALKILQTCDIFLL